MNRLFPIKVSFHKILIIFIFSGIGTSLFAQQKPPLKSLIINRIQLSMGIGIYSFMGDLGGSPLKGQPFLGDINPQNFRPGLQIAPRFKYFAWASQKIFLNVGWLNGNDAYSLNPGRRSRNLSFNSPVIQGGTQLEIYFLPDKTITRKAGILPKSVNRYFGYVFAGVSGFWFNPFTVGLTGAASLPGLATEGVAYPTTSIAYPVGIGVEFIQNQRWNIGVEVGHCFTKTDYIDDVSGRYPDFSQMSATAAYFSGGKNLNGMPNPGAIRGNPAQKDGWFFVTVNFVYKFRDKENPSAGVNCPVFTKKGNRKGKKDSDPLKFGKEYSKKAGKKMKVKDNAQKKIKTQ